MRMYKRELDRELEAVGPDEGQIRRLLGRLEQPAPPPRRLTRRAAAALAVCAALALTALAAGPTLWELLTGVLGPFAPYAEPLDGTATDQEVRVEVAGALTDGYGARVYYTVTDLTGGRFNDHTQVRAMLEGEALGAGTGGNRVLSWDGEKGTLLVETRMYGADFSRDAVLELRGFDPSYRYATQIHFQPPQAPRTLETAVTADGETVLLPGQNPQASPDSRDFSISSMGFDPQGLFHIRMTFQEGYTGPGLLALPYDRQGNQMGETLEITEIGSDRDYCIADLTPDDLKNVDHIRAYGEYHGPETPMEGIWRIPLTLEPVECRQIDVDREIGGFPVKRVQMSPLGVTVFYRHGAGDGGLFYGDSDVQITNQMGETVELSLQISGQDSKRNGAFSIWACEAPVALESIASITLLGETIWCDGALDNGK